MLLRAAARLAPNWPDVRFVLVGDGGEREALQRFAHDLGIRDQVLMPGRIANEPGFAGIFDIAVLTSREEGFPNWVVEAMAAGRAVVATNVGGIPDAVLDGETGALVASGDDEALVRALDRLLRDDELRLRMGAAAGNGARSLYHVNTIMRTLESLFMKILQLIMDNNGRGRYNAGRCGSGFFGSHKAVHVFPCGESGRARMELT